MNLIGNNCCNAYWYQKNNLKFKNPFMWMILDFPYMLDLCQNYDKINFNNFRLYQGELNKKDYFGIIIDEKIKTEFVHYRYHPEFNEIKQIGVEKFSKNIHSYTVSKYVDRIKRMNEKPVFMIMDYKDNYNNINTQEIIDKTNFPIIIFTNFDYNIKNNLVKLIKTNESNVWHRSLLPEDFISKYNVEINIFLKEFDKRIVPMNKPIVLADHLNPILIQSNENLFNCSIFKKDNKVHLIGRTSNYTFINVGGGLVQFPTTAHIFSNQNLFKINLKTGELNFEKPISKCDKKAIEKYKISGMEDVRIANWNNKFIVTFSKVFFDSTIPKTTCDICYSELNENNNLVNTVAIQTNKIEKNWSPIISENYLNQYVYSYKPFKIINIKNLKIEENKNNVDINLDLRGSTPLLPYRNGFISLAHIKTSDCTYLHYFIKFDEKLNIIEISNPISFFNMKIEFTTSLYKENDVFYLPVSVQDQISYIFKFDETFIEQIFSNEIKPMEVENSYFNRIKKDLKNNRNIFGYLTLCTFENYSTEDELNLIEFFDDLSPTDKCYLYNIFWSKFKNK